ncbi:hypothetical protein D4R42_02460 [bacterium]|nr:MAG: hypothetical protein D4R42_02460 [bacterium]
MRESFPQLNSKMAEIRTDIAQGKPYKPTARNIFGDLPVLTGGTRTFEVAQLSALELARLVEFLDYYAATLEKSAPAVAEDFRAQQGFFIDCAAYAKARFENKPYNEDEVAELPRAGQLGAQVLISRDLRAIGDAVNLKNNWDIAAVVNVPGYIFGTAAIWYTTNWVTTGVAATIDQRSVVAIMKNGVVESGTTPTISQFQYTTQGQTYLPWRSSILRDVQVECDKPVYQYHTPGALLLTPDLGARLQFYPTRTETISPRLLGLVFGEWTYLNVFAPNV